MIDLLRRAWDTLDSFKQTYPENWNEEDEQVLKGLMRADLKLSGVKLKWHGLTNGEIAEAVKVMERGNFMVAIQNIETRLKELNT